MSPMIPPASSGVAYLSREKTGGRGGLEDDLDSIDGRKVPQAMADYRDSDVRCAVCRYFDGTDSCSKVDGVITPDSNSKYFVRAEPELAENEEEEVRAV